MNLPELLSYDVKIIISGLNSGNVTPNFTRPIALSFVVLYMFKDSFKATVLHRFVFVRTTVHGRCGTAAAAARLGARKSGWFLLGKTERGRGTRRKGNELCCRRRRRPCRRRREAARERGRRESREWV